jgi:asparagine synthase (glutamine-hydrolysing)
MCGIAGIFLKQSSAFNLAEKIADMTHSIAHRGPDGEGFILANPQVVQPLFGSFPPLNPVLDLKYAPKLHLKEANGDYSMALGHRRLSIIDLSEAGHQPMCSQDGKNWLVFNGEVYNYIELRAELKLLGHSFLTECDTEVVLAAYNEWGEKCVSKFNGMWAFCIYDAAREVCFASRDRIGVKPFYYLDNQQFFSFASEQKAFVKAGLIPARIDEKALHQYLVNGKLEAEENNFFEGIKELQPGCNLTYSLKNQKVFIEKYYAIEINDKNDRLSDEELIGKIKGQLQRSVEMRLRSDVEVGTCLSGGIDSSVLSCLMHQILKKEIVCFTSVFRGQKFNEEKYADLVASQIGAKHVKVEPGEKEFLLELDELVFSQDVPIWDTSTYAQFKVMQLASNQNIKVVLDGQGADELFGGYHHHFMAKWNSLMSDGKFFEAYREIRKSGKTVNNPFLFFAKEKVKQKFNLGMKINRRFLTGDFIEGHEVINPVNYFSSANEQMVNDIEKTRLKSFLKCEDRAGMWHSVESRTPFSDDVDLLELMFSFDGNRKIKNGVSKYLLREASRDILPKPVYERYDKRGFETPMQLWLSKLLPVMLQEITELDLPFVNYEQLQHVNKGNLNELKLVFKLFILARWKKVFTSPSL